MALHGAQAKRLPEWASMTGEYSQDPFQQAVISNLWEQFNQQLPGIYAPISAQVSSAGRTGSGIHNRLLGEAGNRALLGMTGQVGQLQSQDYQDFMNRKMGLVQSAQQEDAALRNALAGIRSARISARPSLISSMMGAGSMMDYAMNPYAQGMGYLGQYNQNVFPYQQAFGFTPGQSSLHNFLQGAAGGAAAGAGVYP